MKGINLNKPGPAHLLSFFFFCEWPGHSGDGDAPSFTDFQAKNVRFIPKTLKFK